MSCLWAVSCILCKYNAESGARLNCGCGSVFRSVLVFIFIYISNECGCCWNCQRTAEKWKFVGISFSRYSEWNAHENHRMLETAISLFRFRHRLRRFAFNARPEPRELIWIWGIVICVLAHLTYGTISSLASFSVLFSFALLRFHFLMRFRGRKRRQRSDFNLNCAPRRKMTHRGKTARQTPWKMSWNIFSILIPSYVARINAWEYRIPLHTPFVTFLFSVHSVFMSKPARGSIRWPLGCALCLSLSY